MTEVPDDEDDDIPEMVEEVWDGRGSWYGGDVAVARSMTADGDAILTVTRGDHRYPHQRRLDRCGRTLGPAAVGA